MAGPVQLLIHGARGRMGQAVQCLCAHDAKFAIAAAVSRSVGQRVIEGVPQFAAAELAGVPEFDVAVDFSLPDAFDPLLNLCVQRGRALLSGTTGLAQAQYAALDAASAKIPVLWSSNFSLGVAVLSDLVERAVRALPGWDCDIVDTHHSRKQDAPSGTALSLGEAATLGGATPRYASIRAGDIVGEHLVQLTSAGERIELVHRASDRNIFARGALHAAAALAMRPPGRYRLRDLL